MVSGRGGSPDVLQELAGVDLGLLKFLPKAITCLKRDDHFESMA